MTLTQKAFALMQYPLPHHAISRLAGLLAECRSPGLKNALIRAFIRHFKVDMSQAQEPDYRAYATFNDFFTRALTSDARPVGEGFISPADGTLSQFGRMAAGELVQAKGHRFSTRALLGGDAALAETFAGGSFATVYLSPRDYHRVHMPIAGTLRETIYVPGRLFSVNQATAGHVPGLFARNERLVCIFDTANGPLAVVLVGAMIVAAIETVWAGQITPLAGTPQHTRMDEHVTLEKGAELGRFKLGSTVVMCTADPMSFCDFPLGAKVQMGQGLGHMNA